MFGGVDGSKTTVSSKDSDILSDFYLHASADPCQVICSVLLNENNYEMWSKLMRNALRAKNKLGFIDGVITKPKEGNKSIKLWGIVNSSMLVAWILNAIEPKLRGFISCLETAYEL
ncbi:hypothetical protein V5N11_008737 [Cardamine amara subsp. amara]|uniref:Retrotransposon Copia-like N-terminal domain-containing protein n=1 Tax=Cardamine amara subsp. amara TaxID=228776 RepID=A0ABD1C941_CARAN